eukprot:gene22462-9871_t
MFMYLATQTMHNPTQVPSYYSDMYPNPNSKGGNGGVRVVAFASGGFLPASRHGLVLHGIMHNAD